GSGGPPAPGRPPPAPRAAARGSRPGRAGRRARRAASARRPPAPRRPPRTPPRPCAGRWSGRSVLGPTGSRAAGARSAPGDRAAPLAGRGATGGGQPVVAAVVVVAAGASPLAYETFDAYSFFTPSSHVCSAALRFCCSSCCLIDSLTCANGVDWRGLAFWSAWMMCQPYLLRTGFDSCPVRSANATFSNCGTNEPRVSVSCPPLAFELGSIEYFFARAAKLAPAFSWA